MYMNIKNIIREKIDDLSWMDEILAHKYPIGSTIEPIDGHYFYSEDSFKKGLQSSSDKIHGYHHGVITDIVDGKFYKIQLFGEYSDTPLDTEYYLLMSDLDGLKEGIDGLEWMDDVSDVDPLYPKPGYVYYMGDYSNGFMDWSGPTTDMIVVTSVRGNDIEFNTIPSFWPENDPDSMRISQFIKDVKRGDIFFIRVDNVNESLSESVSDDLSWIREVTPFNGGSHFLEDDICFIGTNQKSCEGDHKVKILEDKIVFNLVYDEWLDSFGGSLDDDIWYLEPIMEHGGDYFAHDDYYELERDETEYVFDYINIDNQVRVLNFLTKASPKRDIDDEFDTSDLDSEMEDIGSRIDGLWDDFVDVYLYEIGHAIQKNRWGEISAYFRYITTDGGNRYHTKFSIDVIQGKLILEISKHDAIKLMTKLETSDLTNLLSLLSSVVVDQYWSDSFSDTWDTSGAEEGVNEAINHFLVSANKELESTITESDDFEWASEVEPSMRDKQDFSRSNTLNTSDTTTIFGNDVNVGDKFLPPNSGNVWEIVNMELRYQLRGLGLDMYFVKLKTDFGKKKNVWWEKPQRHTQPNGSFPRRNRPWRKVTTPITETEDELSWMDDIEPIIPFDQIITGQYYRIYSVNGELMKNSFNNCGGWPLGLPHPATADDFKQHFEDQRVFVSSMLNAESSHSNCVGVDTVWNLLIEFDNDTNWWCHEGMFELTSVMVTESEDDIIVEPSDINEGVEDGLGWMRDVVPDGKLLIRSRVESFIEKYASHWEDFEVTFENITNYYDSGVTELGRVWVNRHGGLGSNGMESYCDILMDDDSYIVELYEEHGNSYEVIEHERFFKLNDAIHYVFETMIED